MNRANNLVVLTGRSEHTGVSRAVQLVMPKATV